MCAAAIVPVRRANSHGVDSRHSITVQSSRRPTRSNPPNVRRSTAASSSEDPARRSEQALIRQAIEGDPAAQDELFARHRLRLYRLALRLLRSREEAEDAVQDALLSAYRNLDSFEGRSLFSTWLTRIVVNAALVRMRRQRARPELFLQDVSPDERSSIANTFADSHPDPEQAYAYVETRRLVTGVLETLSPSIRSAFQLRELQDLSNSEAARASGVQVGAFKSRISRARSQLAERFTLSAIAPLQKPTPMTVPTLRGAAHDETAQRSLG